MVNRMVEPSDFYQALKTNGIDFFSGVPDSTLKEFCAYLDDHAEPGSHIISANEGGAIALAAGYHLATGKEGLVYMQNSGIGNATNPLLSLVDPDIYGIPVLILIGWRGEPGTKDEPQHVKQGRITLSLLDAMEIPYHVLDSSIDETRKAVAAACLLIQDENRPYALIVRKGFFAPHKSDARPLSPYPMTREEAIKIIVNFLDEDDIVVSTTGMTSRELFEYRESTKAGHRKDFLTVGSMGHCCQIAVGIALNRPERRVVCIDGDGSAIMHLGSWVIAGTEGPENFIHVVINNAAHDSVGGQPTAGNKVDFPAIARACGYRWVASAGSIEGIKKQMQILKVKKGPSLLEAWVRQGARKDLGRPTTTPIENKREFMEFLGC